MLHLSAAVVDLARGHVRRHTGEDFRLTSTERALLQYLAEHPDQDLTREQLLTDVWGYRPGVSSRALDTAIKTLRRKLGEDTRSPQHLLTVRGVGYRFVPPVAVQDDSVVGRGALRAQLRERLQAPGVVLSLVGLGGVGKSCLAAVVATAVPGAVMVPMAEAVDVPARVALALDGQRLSDCTLLVLDDVEAVRDEVAAWLVAMRVELPDLRVLVTSRVPLDIPHEEVVRVGPLDDASARTLLERRLRIEAGSDFQTPTPEVLDALVDALEGLPLAIELAAARARVLSPETLLERLARPGVLARRGGATRQRSAEAVVEWSWSLLAPDAREALADLALFAGPFPVEAAEAVLGESVALDQLEVLAEASLVRREGDRLSLLSIVARFARTQGLGSPGAVERHARWAVGRHERFGSDTANDAPELIAALGRELPDALRIEALLALAEVYRRTGPNVQPFALIQEASTLAGMGPDRELTARAAVMLAEEATSVGHSDALDRAHRSLAHALRAPGARSEWMGRSLHVLAVTFRHGGRLDLALTTASEALPHLDADPILRPLSLMEIALIERLSGQPEPARAHLEAAITQLLAQRSHRLASQAMLRIAPTERALGRVEPARRWLEHAVELSKREALPLTTLAALGALAELDLDVGTAESLDRSEARLDEVDALLDAGEGTPFFTVLSPALRALWHLERDAPLRAQERAALAVERCRGKDLPEAAYAWLAHGVVAAVTLGVPVATERLRTAVGKARASGQGRFEGIALAYLEVLESDGDAHQRAVEITRGLSDQVLDAVLAVARGEPVVELAGFHGRRVRSLRD